MVPKGYYAFLFKRSGSQDVSVRFPDHPNIVTSGHDWKHAEEMALEALTGCLEVGLDADCPLPAAGDKPDIAQRKRLIFVPLAASLRVSYILRDSRKQAGLSYKEVAERIGHKGSYRAVAGACSRNFVPLVIPCHRVIASDGSLGGFSAGEGVEVKERLLLLEDSLRLK